MFPQTGDNHYFTPSGKIVVECGGSRWSLKEFQDRGYDFGTTQNKPVNTTVLIGWGKELLGF